ncbi:VOC family protein [Curtobacterium sp. RRHDQ10]|uniref:VOC family protein n=1 Tax=Curtobacterium phyllosphaerae TaxID=3413379 RepID=UPI003BEF6455
MIDATKAFSGFSVRDPAAARTFYEDVLDLTVTEEHGMLSIDLGGGRSVLAYPKGDAHEPASFTVLNFPVPDVDAAVDDLASRGVAFLHYEGMTDDKGVNRQGGPLIAWFTDPSGNVMSVIEGG